MKGHSHTGTVSFGTAIKQSYSKAVFPSSRRQEQLAPLKQMKGGSTCSASRQWPACKHTVPCLDHEELSESHNKSCLHNFVGAVWSCVRGVYTSQRHDRVLSIRRDFRIYTTVADEARDGKNTFTSRRSRERGADVVRQTTQCRGAVSRHVSGCGFLFGMFSFY